MRENATKNNRAARAQRADAPADDPWALRGFRERRVASLFEEVLGVRVDRADADFFALGGGRDTVDRLLDVIDEDAGVRLTPETISECPTVRALARRVAGSRATRRGRVVGYGTDLPGRPFFFVVPGYQARVVAREFVARTGRPFYALQRAGLEGRSFTDWTVPARARRALGDLRAVQPVGPYSIGGYCGGSWVAFEVARQLRELGEEVDLFVCVDLWAPIYRPMQLMKWKMVMRWERVTTWSPERGPVFDVRRRALFLREVGRDWGTRLKWWALSPTAGWWQRPLTKQGTLMFEAGSPLYDHYFPEPVDFDVTLIRGAPFGGYDWAVRREPHDMAWNRLSRGPVDVLTVSGDHISMLESDTARELGSAIARVASGVAEGERSVAAG